MIKKNFKVTPLLQNPHLPGAAIIQVFLNKFNTRSEISRVELIWYVPTQWSKFASFLKKEPINKI